MADINAALIAVIGVLAGGYVNNFLAEDYRRFRDSQALAGAIGGELASHGSVIADLRSGLDNMLAAISRGEKLNLPEWPQAPSPVFDIAVEKIGLLGSDLARDVAFVYEQIRAFRITFSMLSVHHETMSEGWRSAMVPNCTGRIESATTLGTRLVEALTSHAKKNYWIHSSIAKYTTLGAVLIVGVLFFSVFFARASDLQTRCVSTVERGSLQTICGSSPLPRLPA